MRSILPGLWLAWAVALGGAAGRADTLPPWSPGYLDIHQISTGRGNAALIICPDGTSVMIDAGASNSNPAAMSAARPDESRRPGEWIARYALRHLAATGRSQLDYFIATHLHPDHIGDVGPHTPLSPTGKFYLSGVTDVAAALPIGKLIGRDHRRVPSSIRFPAGFIRNYEAFAAWRSERGEQNEAIKVGATDQLGLRHAPDTFPRFAIRTVAADAAVWTGVGEDVRSLLAAEDGSGARRVPDENMCSIALKLSYGKFDYFTGGDLASDTAYDTEPWRDVETPVARAVGAVEVAVANHHGYFDAVGPEAVRALQPAVWVVPAWHVSHPGMAQLKAMLSETLYSGPRRVFIADLAPTAALLHQRFLSQVASQTGHVVVRVAPGGDRFWVFVTKNEDETDTVKAEYGPFEAR